MTRAKFPRPARVTAQRDFAKARRTGRTHGDDVLRLTVVPNGRTTTRLGLAVPRRTTAVERNRVKRMIREAFRVRRPSIPKGYDLVVAPRNHEKACDFEAVTRSFDALIERAFGAQNP
jgi:ribonuclease P protein component